MRVYFFSSFILPVLHREHTTYALREFRKQKVSVVIAAKNESHHLKSLLNGLKHQQYPDFEVVVALDDTDDNSREVIEEIFPEALILKSSGGKKKALALAMSRASGEWMLLTDADCVPMSHHWIFFMTAPLAHQADMVLGYGKYWPQNTWINHVIRTETLLTAINYAGFALNNKAYMGVGRNLAFSKAAFDSIGGYTGVDHILPGDDDLLVLKFAANHKNIVFEFTNSAQTISIPKVDLKGWLKQKKRHQFSGMYYPLLIKLGLWVQGLSTFLLYFIATTLLFSPVWYIGLSALLFQAATTIYTAWRSSLMVSEKLVFWFTPLFEIILLGVKFVTSVAIFRSKNISWT